METKSEKIITITLSDLKKAFPYEFRNVKNFNYCIACTPSKKDPYIELGVDE